MKRLLFVLLLAWPPLVALASPAGAAGTERAVLVTGASSGIGRRIAETLAENGYYVYAGARKPADIDALSAIDNMQGVRLDVTRQDEIDAAVELVRRGGRGLYGLVNNAGVFLFDPLVEVSERDMRFIFDVNVLGPYRVTRAFAPLLIESRGRVTTTGSIASAYSSRLFGPYSMSKAAMDSYTEALASEMKKFGVAVSIVQPGNFRSNIMRNMQRRLAQLEADERASLWSEEIERFAAFTQSDRSHHADPAPVAAAVLDFLTSPEPRLRYLVTPSEREAQLAVRGALKRVVEMNEGHAYTLSHDELAAMLGTLLRNGPAQ